MTALSVTAQLNDRWRVVHDLLQWILEVRQGRKTGKATGWRGMRFCQWRRTLIRDIGELCGDVDATAMVIIEALPERHPSILSTSCRRRSLGPPP
jgi:hypothetical protein